MELDPELWELPHLRAWVARHEFGKVFAYLTEGPARILTQRQLARLIDCSQSQIHEIIHGRQVWAYPVLERYSVTLSIPRGYMGIAFTSNPGSDGRPEPEPGEAETSGDGGKEDDGMERRRFVANGAVAVFGSVILGSETDFFIPFTHPEIRSHVGVDDVKSVRDLTAFARRQDGIHGYGSSADLLSRELPGIYRLLKASMKDTVRIPLLVVVADAYMVAGASRADTGNLSACRAMFARSLKLAKEADDHSLMTKVLLSQALVDGREGHVDDALKLVQLAGVAMPYGLPASDAAIHEAWLYAQLGIPDEAIKFLKKARDLYEKHHTDKPLPPWLTGFNSYGPAGLTEATFRELSAHDSTFLDRAVPAAEAAVQKAPEHDRSRTLIATSRAAELHLRAGERATGLKLAADAVTTAEGLSVVGDHTKTVMRTDLTRMLTACRDSTAADLTRRIAVIAA
ncbi:MAG: helix-turn-helix transcriptional regulator [Actinomycetota bacterium]|nr:helix-turn-helix transcriptional regulator [Actinomycetota bacterium]